MLTVAIQAGGQSLRMGSDKGLLPLAGKPLIEHRWLALKPHYPQLKVHQCWCWLATCRL
jgi:molybdopterin-guanine dinucleotide biosynthesis protein A